MINQLEWMTRKLMGTVTDVANSSRVIDDELDTSGLDMAYRSIKEFHSQILNRIEKTEMEKK